MSLKTSAGALAAGVMLRPMRPDDLDAVLRIQREAHGDDYQESAEVLGRKLQLAPDACWFAECEGVGLGYVFAHSWAAGVPPLHAPIARIPPHADQGFLHDLAVSPQARGAGVGGGLLERVMTWSQRLGHGALELVALPDALGYWRGFGFVAQPVALPAGYGEGAAFMRRVRLSGD